VSFYVPDEESLPPIALRDLQRRKLTDLVRAALPTNAFYAAKLGAVPSGERCQLAELPFTTREELQADQAARPPFGTNLTFPVGSYQRLHQTSGSAGEPLRWLDTADNWAWWKKCWGIIYRAADVRPADRLFFPFSFGPFIGFWGAFETSVSLGNLSLPAGGMTTTARLRHLLDHEGTFVCCTPTYALRMAEVAREQGIDLAGSTVRGLIVAGEPGGNVPATRSRIESAFGARVFDHAGMTEVGPWGFECLEAPGGLHVMESEFIAEVIDPRTDAVVPEGETGELVLTNLGRTGSPLIRYRTGDQVRLIRARCACGRWFARAEGGILGRVDDMLTIRGNNVFPSTVEGIIRRFSEIAEFSLEIDERATLADLNIRVEPFAGIEATGLADRVADAIRDRLHFRPTVTLAEPGRLPRFEMKAKRLIRHRPPGADRSTGTG
jgi:phenylacetate-CoA ligase